MTDGQTESSTFQHHLEVYEHWKADIAGLIGDYRDWLQLNGQLNEETELRINGALDTLHSDRLTIAFVAEFSRGKSELINAIFFADYKRRLLPSKPGRTTMCPTELFFDRIANQTYLRLLPIETRLEDRTVAEFKRHPEHWHTIHLDRDSPGQISTALHEIIRTKTVSRERAKALGLFSDEATQHFQQGNMPDQIEIPVWRHALISFPHPLLAQGLVILDTPGLNALGTEPELTLSMLPSVQAVFFVLAADTAVTRSDLGVWQYHIMRSRGSQRSGLMVVLNKIDTLWDDLDNETDVDAGIAQQCQAAADILGIDRDQVFPVSAKQALLAKVRKDHDLLARSRIHELEAALSKHILPQRQRLVIENVAANISALMNHSRSLLSARLKQLHRQTNELHGIRHKDASSVLQLIQQVHEERQDYLKKVERTQSSQRMLASHAKEMRTALSINHVDQLIEESRQRMQDSFTTAGLKWGMQSFFEGAQNIMENVKQQIEGTRNLVEGIFLIFEREHDLTTLMPPLISVDRYAAELDHLHGEALAFSKSPATYFTEKNLLIRKFFQSLGETTRSIFVRANHDVNVWLGGVLNPLLTHVKEHKAMLQQRLDSLESVNESREMLEKHVTEIDRQCAAIENQLNALDEMRATLGKALQHGEKQRQPARVAPG